MHEEWQPVMVGWDRQHKRTSQHVGKWNRETLISIAYPAWDGESRQVCLSSIWYGKCTAVEQGFQ